MNGPRLSIIPARAATDPALKPRDLQVLCVLGRHTNNLGWCEKSQVKMAAEMGCARSTVFAAIERLVEAGYLERHIQPQENGRDAPHLYRVVLDPPGQPDAAGEVEEDALTPAGIPAPPADIPAPPAGSGPAPKNDPFRTKEREGAGARAEESQPEILTSDDTPGTAAFQKRVMRLCSGRGYVAGPWRDWDAEGNGSIGWVTGQFAALNPEERREAERWRDAYLADIAGRKVKPKAPGLWLRDRIWTGLDPALLDRMERQKQAVVAPEKRAQPDGWESCLGPVGMACLLARIIAAGAGGAVALGPFFTDSRLREAWPTVWEFAAIQRQKGGTVFPQRWHACKGLMEPVPHDSVVLAAWRRHFEDRGWPWLGVFDRIDVVYLPKLADGEGDGTDPPDLDDRVRRAVERFEQAVRGTGDDGGRSEAA